MTIPCRVLPHRRGSGAENMALDEALLESVAARPDSAVIRTYEWSVPTLTLGYFQSYRLPDTEPRWRDAAILRRPTGGGAIWHDREITYAVVVPRTHPLAHKSTDLYRAIHQSLKDLLISHGVDAQRRADVEPPRTEHSKPLLCFLDSDPEDIVVGGQKIVGSAQRRRAGAVLQHGSLLIGRSPTTPELPGVAELQGVDQDQAAWAESVRNALPGALGLSPFASDFLPEELREAETLADVVYRNPSWNQRR